MSDTMITDKTGYFAHNYTPTDDHTIRLFIGTSENHDKTIEKIYTYSILKNTTSKVDITFLRPSMFPDWKRQGWGTPFTCFRYAIPELCNFKGKAIYTDVDMINFRDIAHLWRTDLKGKAFGMVWDSLQMNSEKFKDTDQERGWWCDSVMLIDCEKAKPYVHSIEEQAQSNKTYKWAFMAGIGSPYKEQSKDVVLELDARWNSFDGADTSYPYKRPYPKDERVIFRADEIWQLHLTALSYQPWHPKYNPYAKASHRRQDLMDIYWQYNKEVKMLESLGEV